MEPRRVTPLIVLPDIEVRLVAFVALGFEPIDSGVAGVVNLGAGNSFVILATAAAMAVRYRPDTVALLTGRTALLVHVTSLAEAVNRLPASARVVDRLEHPKPEAVVRDGDGVIVFTERPPGPRWPGAAVGRIVH